MKKMASLKNTFTVTYILILLSFVSSCGPKVLDFKAVPNNICTGDETTVSWKEKGAEAPLEVFNIISC